MDPMTMATIASMLYSAGKDIFGKKQQPEYNELKQVTNFDKNQQALWKQIHQMLGPQGQLGQGYSQALSNQQQMMDMSPEAFDKFSQPYINEFNQQTVPGLAERFAGAGAMGGGLSSSGFGQSLSAAGGNLQSQLAALKAGIGQQAAQSLMGQYGNMQNMAMNAQPFSYQQTQQQQLGATPNFLNSWGQSGFSGSQDMWKNLLNLFGKGGGMQGNSSLPAGPISRSDFGI